MALATLGAPKIERSLQKLQEVLRIGEERGEKNSGRVQRKASWVFFSCEGCLGFID